MPCDHVAVRIVIQKPLYYCGTVKRIPGWMSEHPVFWTILKYPDEPFAALADFTLIIEKARRRTRQELLRNTLGSPSAELLIASTAMRDYRNRHFGHIDVLLRSMGASRPLLRPVHLGMYQSSWVEPNNCQSHTGERC